MHGAAPTPWLVDLKNGQLLCSLYRIHYHIPHNMVRMTLATASSVCCICCLQSYHDVSTPPLVLA